MKIMETAQDYTFLNDMRKYFESGQTLSYEFRKKQLLRLRELIIDHEEEIYNALHTDLKKTKEECWVTEIGLLLQELRYTLKNLRSWMHPEKVKTNLLNLPSASYIYPSPRGVVLVIGPWNFPLQLLLIPVMGAMAAGNCVLLKPSELAPATSALINRMFSENFPPEYCKVIEADGATVIPSMMERFRFDHIFYTGSIPVGRSIYQQAAKDLIPVTLELGGKDPCIVEPDADIEVAARRIAISKFTNAGQMCVSPDYLLVHESVKDKLIVKMKESISQFYGANPAICEEYGKIINTKRFDRLASYISQGTVLHGGALDRTSLYIEPTLLDNVSTESEIMKEEIFGPILPIFSYTTEEEVFSMVSLNPNPLSLYIFTKDKKRADWWLERIPSGTACINNAAWQFSNHHLPFGGIGNSGMGAYHGKFSFDVFTHKKAVMRSPVWFDPAIKYPPLKGRLKLLKFFLR